MLRVCVKGAARCLGRRGAPPHPQQFRFYTAGDTGSAGKAISAGLVMLGSGVGSTILYAKWDPKFRTMVEKNVPYSDRLFDVALGPSSYTAVAPTKKQKLDLFQPPSMMSKEESSPTKLEGVKEKEETTEGSVLQTSPAAAPTGQSMEEASTEVSHIISAITEVPSVPAPCDTEASAPKGECTECHSHDTDHITAPLADETAETGTVLTAEAEKPLEERPVEEVAARLAEQDQEEQDVLASISASLEDSLGSAAKSTLQAIGAQEAALQAIALHTQKLKEAMDAQTPPEEHTAEWKDLEAAVAERNRSADDAGAALLKAKESLDSLRSKIDEVKGSKVTATRPLVLAVEENLHSMVVDLDQVVTKVQSAESEAKIISQYSELVNEAKQQFQKELSSITPDIQANWRGLAGKLSADDLNALITHAHRRIDQLNRELAEQRVREQIHIEAALEQQKQVDHKALEKAVNTALVHSKEEARLQHERKLSEVREVMEAEMRTQLRRQAAAHTDHLRDVLKVQEQELKAESEEVLSSKMLEQETHYRRLMQEELDNFTLDINTAYVRLKGIEDAIDSHIVAEEEARKAHQLWLSVEALNYTLKTAGANSPTEPLQSAVVAIRESCHENEFAQALASAFPEESLHRGIYSEESLRSRFYFLRSLARRVALIDESHNSLYQYFLSYLQAALLFEEKEEAPPTQFTSKDLDPFKIISYASYCLEQGDLELAAKLLNQLRGEARNVVQGWLTEARLTLETRQLVNLLSAYANAVGLGTTQAP
ncbi:MICOS complex subunit MIC60 isoform X2 [Lampris incognitus]|uniref:MICOS complex subunit MIC60 isoform X2 n=1 Tax=Lampris incognitus TaxID=2546036 RepID=UPI0024B5E0A1|nr:MICOS complex subunit MIC60 isoform X2 [Lampris incognitus]